MDVTDMIYKVIDEKCMKQSAVARAAVQGCPMNHFCVSWKGKKRFQ